MIKKIIFPLVAIIFLSSCANKFSLQKRKYTKGFYFASTKNNSQKEEGTKVSHLKAKPINKNVSVEDNAQTENVIAVIKKEPINDFPQITQKTQVNHSKQHKQILASANNTIVQSIKTFKNLGIISKPVNTTGASKGKSDTNLIVLVILCFLWWLNLLAVYIHDGNSITINFWITLLLDFTIIGGIIFSLLVVLDIVDLK